MAESGQVIVENARLIFKNFTGVEGRYNREGDRNFCLVLDDDLAKNLLRDGWPVKSLSARDEDDSDTPYLPVNVSFKNRPPSIVLISMGHRTALGEDEVEILDWAEIENIDLTIRPYQWEVGEKSGVKAYLKNMFVTLVDDPLVAKYSDIPTK